ncbi:unnamed protein product [Natator depressus]
MENQTTVTEFILLGLSNDSCLQMPLFLVFFVIYLITLVEYMVVVLVIKADPHLHTPMYFLSNLSFLDIYYSSVTVPKMLENFLAERKMISLSGCIAQIFFLIFMFGTEIFLLSAMAYDQYASICNSTTMSQHVGVQMLLGDWVSGFLDSSDAATAPAETPRAGVRTADPLPGGGQWKPPDPTVLLYVHGREESSYLSDIPGLLKALTKPEGKIADRKNCPGKLQIIVEGAVRLSNF